MNINYKKLSHLRTVGKIESICFPKNVAEIQKAYMFAEQNGLVPFPLGGGSNTLFGYCQNYLIISDKYFERIWEYEDSNNHIVDAQGDTLNQRKLVVSANTNINSLIMRAAGDGLGGLEFLAGIPAHLGGLIFMNAGADDLTISDFIEWITIVDRYGERTLQKNEIDFQYKNTNIKGFITKACLNLYINDFLNNQDINKNLHYLIIKQQIIDRKKKQPLEMPNLGCFFKNHPKYPAGLLIEHAGLKGFKIGGAMVSEKHANFLINTGNATFEDFILLIDYVKEAVFEKYNIALELEVRIING